jgi:hypothetical protein
MAKPPQHRHGRRTHTAGGADVKQRAKQRKQFFFEKKNQKTFICWSLGRPSDLAGDDSTGTAMSSETPIFRPNQVPKSEVRSARQWRKFAQR